MNAIRRSMSLAVLAAAAISLFAAPAMAQSQIDHHASASPDRVGPGDRLRYEVEISVEGNYEVQLTHRPQFGEFTVRGQSSAPSTVVTNGKVRQSLTLSYALQAPREKGRYEITPPRFRVGSEVVEPNAVTLRVVDGDELPRDEPESAQDRKAFVEISVDPDRDPYVGEQLVARYDLYVDQRHRSMRPRTPQEPALDDFWAEELSNHLRLRRTRTYRHGRSWQVTPLRVVALFPIEPGPASIDTIDVPLATSGLFGNSERYVARAEDIPLEVKPLPDGAPDSFSSGNVGDWDLDVAIDSHSARVGGYLTVTATVDGIGRVGRLGAPTLDLGDTFDLVATTDRVSESVRDAKLGGQKTFEFTLMPLEAGKQTLPPVKFSYFDPELGDYVELSPEPIELRIEEGQLPATGNDENTARADQFDELIEDPLADLSDLADPDSLRTKSQSTIPFSPWLIIAPLLLLLGLWLEPRVADPILLRLSPRRRRRRLRQDLDRLLETPSPTQCLRALRHTLNAGLGCRLGALTVTDVAHALEAIDLPEALRDDTIALVDRLIGLRYAPQSSDEAAPVDTTWAVIDDLIDWKFDDHDNGPSSPAPALLVGLGLSALVAAALAPVDVAADEAEPPQEQLDQQQPSTEASEAGDIDWNARTETWVARASEDPSNATAHFNAGTAAAHSGRIGLSRWHLERAMALGAVDKDLRHNLAAVTDAVAAQNPAVATFYQQRPAAQIFRLAAPWIALALLWIATALAMVRRLLVGRERSAAQRWILAGLLVAVLAIAGLWLYLVNYDRDASLGVVMADAQVLQQAPSDHAARAYDSDIPAGAVVQIKEKRDDWTQVVLPSRNRGWLPTASVEAVDH